MDTRSQTEGDRDVAKQLGIGKRRRGRPPVWLLLILIAALVGGGLVTWRNLASRASLDDFVTAEAVRGDLRLIVAATGQVEPINQVEVGAEISGLIAEVLVDFNDEVRVDQVLARLDTDQLEARVLQAEANLAQAQAGVAQAEATVREARARRNRTVELAGRGVASSQQADVDEASLARAIASVAAAEAQVRVAEAQLAQERTTLSKAEIRSPVNGIVLDRRIEPGQAVASSFQTPVLFLLAEDLTQMELHVDIDEADIGRVAVNQSATFSVDAYPERSFAAAVTEIRNAPRTLNGVVTYQGILSVPNDDLSLKPGMTANAEIETRRIEGVTLVPNEAFRFTPPGERFEPVPPGEDGARQGRLWIWAMGAPRPVTVPLGETDGSLTEIPDDALPAGATILTDQAIEAP